MWQLSEEVVVVSFTTFFRERLFEGKFEEIDIQLHDAVCDGELENGGVGMLPTRNASDKRQRPATGKELGAG